jgi:hypothetical protein
MRGAAMSWETSRQRRRVIARRLSGRFLLSLRSAVHLAEGLDDSIVARDVAWRRREAVNHDFNFGRPRSIKTQSFHHH